MNIHDFIDDEDDDKEQSEASGSSKDEEDDDDKSSSDKDSDSEGEGEGEGEGVDEEREALRAQRREERRLRKIAQRVARENQSQYIAGLQEQVRNLTDRLTKAEGRQTADDTRELDRSIRGAERQRELLKARIRKAAEEGDGQAVADATDELTGVNLDLRQLLAFKERIGTSVDRKESAEDDDGSKEQQQRKPTEDEVKAARATVIRNNTNIFLSKKEHSWFKPKDNSDPDSVTLRQIDAEVAKEFDPATADYWEELEDRVREKLPHRYGQPARKPAERAPVMTGGGARNGQGSRTDIKLSKERVDALKEAGYWEDPKKRNEMIKRYAEYDKQNPRAN